MKIKYKIIAVFILSILISVIVFLAITYGLLNEGYFSGLTSEDMNEAIEQVVEDIKMKSNLSQEEIEDLHDQRGSCQGSFPAAGLLYGPSQRQHSGTGR